LRARDALARWQAQSLDKFVAAGQTEMSVSRDDGRAGVGARAERAWAMRPLQGF
jgi:hypothetical protein